MNHKVAVVGLGYVGLPVALAFARRFPGSIGFDINTKRVDELASGIDSNADVAEGELAGVEIRYTSDPEVLKEATFFVVAVPTPVDSDKRPDLSPLDAASRTVGAALKKGDIVVYESTVYPGVTEEYCGAVLAEVSGLTQSVDFHLGYSPERINPGDKEHTLERIIKIVSGEDEATLAKVSELYGEIITAGVHKAQSIKVAEAAKVIENTQRDLNIALMNELAVIFDLMDINTNDVLDAAATKWNFLRFSPGLVGGHCIGVDPYYLTTKAEQLGYIPQVITAGRRINDSMGEFIAQKGIKLLARAGCTIRGARVGIFGLTFKENISDVRNSRVPSMVKELADFGVEVIVHDPYADAASVEHEFGIKLSSLEEMIDLDAIVLAVSHSEYLEMGTANICKRLKDNRVILDVKSALEESKIPSGHCYWVL
ncbi:UNVERIFIED_CONTAM: hypothetical protein GTU68_023919 [Idotea baltica]|nr:hypothetical protein [Idotea baltica]